MGLSQLEKLGVRPAVNVGRVEQGRAGGLGTEHPATFFMPLHHAPGYAYPLIVWLHSPGDSESQLLRVMPTLSLRNYAAVAVRGVEERDSGGRPKPGFHWNALAYESTCTAVYRAVESMKRRCKIDPRRVYLVGVGEGGTMAQRIVLRNPWSFAGAASLGGRVPDEERLLENYADLSRTRFFYALAPGGQGCGSEQFTERVRLLYLAGVSILVKQYAEPGALQPAVLRDVDRWILAAVPTTIR